MHRLAIQFAASTLAITATMVACSSDIAGAQLITQSSSRSDVQAGRLESQARQALARGDHAQALNLAERAVELSPRDSGFRLLMGELYLRNGRFRSAEAAFRDVLTLDGDNMRAAISLALVQVAQGRSGEAVGQLSQLHGRAPASDLGLAYALAGQHAQAIEMLEQAAREPTASGRVRQNLALAYALSGDWQRARVIAAQDVSPDELNARMEQWAAMSRPSEPWSQVAGLLNVTPVQDPGQPVRLALAPSAPESPAYAEAAPVPTPAPQQSAPVEQPVQMAAVEPAPAPAAAPEPYVVPHVPIQLAAAIMAPAPIEVPVVPTPATRAPTPVEEEIRTTAAVRALVQAQPEIIRPSTAVAVPPRPVFARRPELRQRPAIARLSGGNAPVVVQLGAFSNAQNAERAWTHAEQRFGLAGAQARTTTIDVGGRTLHRVSVAGFSSRGEAVALCESIRSRGGSCFVRATAGDSPVRWASANRRGPRRG